MDIHEQHAVILRLEQALKGLPVGHSVSQVPVEVMRSLLRNTRELATLRAQVSGLEIEHADDIKTIVDLRAQLAEAKKSADHNAWCRRLCEAFFECIQSIDHDLPKKDQSTEALLDKVLELRDMRKQLADAQARLAVAEGETKRLHAAMKTVFERWTFDKYQAHTHTWHDMQDCKEKYLGK